ncbi:MAG: hypothetical protein IPN81_08895 [Nitrosomonadales bacterium]|nr:hypothetical protein [Nitrosomonadales bacterium]
MLAFYQQLHVYAEQRFEFAAFNLEKPLWVCVGSSVTKASGGTQQDTVTSTDVEKIVNFIAHVLHDSAQCIADMASVLETGGANGLMDERKSAMLPPALDICAKNCIRVKRLSKSMRMCWRACLEEVVRLPSSVQQAKAPKSACTRAVPTSRLA